MYLKKICLRKLIINMENTTDINISLSKKDICSIKYIKYKKYISFYNKDCLIDNKKVEDLICPICLNILINPINCSDKKNSFFL